MKQTQDFIKILSYEKINIKDGKERYYEENMTVKCML